MSSLSATQADGYYKPAAYFESGAYKKESISKYNGSKGHNQFLKNGVVRFEVPFHIVCTGCDAVIRKGTRFNAKKKHVSDYFTSKIFDFSMKCYECKGEIIVANDPKMRDYSVKKGGRRQQLSYDARGDGVTATYELGFSASDKTNDDDDDDNGSFDAISNMIKREAGERKMNSEKEKFDKLVSLSEKTGKDTYGNNAGLRVKYREERRAKRKRLDVGEGLFGEGSEIQLLDSTPAEKMQALKAVGGQAESIKKRYREIERKGFAKLRGDSIFSSGAVGNKTKRSKKVEKSTANVVNRAIVLSGALGKASKSTTKMKVKCATTPSTSSTTVKKKGAKPATAPAPIAALDLIAGYGSD